MFILASMLHGVASAQVHPQYLTDHWQGVLRSPSIAVQLADALIKELAKPESKDE